VNLPVMSCDFGQIFPVTLTRLRSQQTVKGVFAPARLQAPQSASWACRQDA
jgi:hypothetical protein